MKDEIFILAGEASGDLHGAMLVKHITGISPGYTFCGIGGSELRREGVHLLHDYADFTAMGIVEPLLKIRFYARELREIPALIRGRGISTAILIDFPGFNLRLARKLAEQQVRVLYYISPQIWAWHYARIRQIKKYVYAIIVFYPFEEGMYRNAGVRAHFLGNPLVDIVQQRLASAGPLNDTLAKPVIALLPGSRISEAKLHLDPMLGAAKLLWKRYGGTILVPVLSGTTGDFIRDRVRKVRSTGVDIRILFDNTYRAIERADLLITSSGTATLEAAILEKPMIVIYRVGILFELLARIFVKVENISLVNIVAGKQICPELLQRAASAQRIFHEASTLLDNPEITGKMITEIRMVKRKLGDPGAMERIARKVVSLIGEEEPYPQQKTERM